MARRYSVLGQLLVWVIEGPETYLAYFAVSACAFVGAFGAAMAWGGGWTFAPVPALLMIMTWSYVRRSQLDYYKRLAREWDGKACPKCRYSFEGAKSAVCPECGTDAEEYLARVRGHIRRHTSGPD